MKVYHMSIFKSETTVLDKLELDKFTFTQRMYIETIEKYKRDNYGKVPSIRELADAMNVSSSATVFDMLKRLKKKGYDYKS